MLFRSEVEQTSQIIDLNSRGLDTNEQQKQPTTLQNENTVDFQYICIRKEYFDIGMIYIKYTNLKKVNYMEIIIQT